MNAALAMARSDARDHVAAGATAAVLAAIHDDAVNLAVWQRDLNAGLACEAADLLRHAGTPLRQDLKVAGLEAALVVALADGGWPPAPRMAADMARLAQHFGAVMDCAAVDVRLEVVSGDACRKYHADYVKARLISSYAGPGSQWLCNADADALAAGVPPGQMMPHQLQPGEVALFKGRRWSHRPIIHRSPPIAGSGQRRLVLVINPAEAEDFPGDQR